MNIFEKLFNKTEKGIKLPIISSVSSMVNGSRHSLPNQRDDSNYFKEYKNWVFACINARAEELASMELYLENKKTDEEVRQHEILDLLNDVNPNSTRYELFFGTQAFLDLTGNAFWYLARDNEGKGKVKQIYLISPDKMNLVVDKDNQLSLIGYMYGKGKEAVPFGVNEILHFKNFNPSGGYPKPHRGVGIVEASLWAIETDNEARNWNYSFFKNSARPDGILKTDQVLGEDEFKRLKEQWEQTQRGSGNNGKPAILEGGLSWQDISKTQKDMDFIAQRTFSRDEILSLFRVPKTVVGITDDVNRANAEASDYVFAKRTIKPLMERFVTILNEYLLPEYDTNLKFEFENPVPEDRLVELQEYSLGINKWLTRNDIRREEGLIESDNGDVFYGPFSDAPQDAVTQTKTVKVSKSDQVIENKVDNFVAKLKKKEITYRKLTNAQKEIHKEIWIKRFDKNEKDLIKDVNGYFKKQEEEVLANAKEEYAGLKPKEFKLKGIDDVLFDEKKAIATGISLITPHLRTFLKEGAEMADSQTGGEFNLNSPDTLKFVQDRSKFFATTINDTTREALLTGIKEALDSDAGFDAIADVIKGVYQQAYDYRTERIARTEVSASLNEGSIQAYKQAGVEDVEWVAVGDDRTADECLANDGQVRKIGDDFPSGESQPPNHINCRCTTVAVFKD
jgi:HK97 family phage portal protein